MKTFKFKTNIQCSSCVAKVTPTLNNEAKIDNWNVDTTNKNKILTIQTNTLDTNQIIDLVKSAGYNAELLAE
ncbi:heavy-metal-associated domain-containing protein [Hydrotalea sandarakina]|jgi:copper chaperone CopZ|uniref:Copper chaperone CopZ n=1 Tax=Hydrotalea sandarakina TaxID=1004304 RepID=A0A2W7SBD8_9BACT|nr:heavy-metal-associated domain-containing protein [Hydrotalea sandarakina]PZX64419.1 copper chaperone CopZ [Hydrotalea sandarakina]